MKRIVSILVLIVTFVGVSFASVVKIGDLSYELDKSNKTALVTDYKKKCTTITIPSSITYKGEDYCVDRIGRYAFSGASTITYISIPNTVRFIGERAFSRCSGLTSITIPNSVIYIWENAFEDCTGLTSITIPKSVSYISVNAFKGCRNMRTVTINSNSMVSMDYIHNHNFDNLGSFFGSQVTEYILGEDVTEIGGDAFQQLKNLKKITIGKNVKVIGDRAFYYCINLTCIEFPDGVESIGEQAFLGCDHLEKIVIPSSVSFIRKTAFSRVDNPKLTIYSASSEWIPDISNSHKKKISPEDIRYYYTFSTFAKKVVEDGINQWQQKGEFERTTEWRTRVTEQTRLQKINELLADAEQDYVRFWVQESKLDLKLGRYDADNEVFVMKDTLYGVAYMAVPYDEAKLFKNNWNNKKLSSKIQVRDDKFKLTALTITMPYGKEYTYRNTDAVTYNLEELDYDFAPINLNFAQTSPQNQQNASPAKRKAVKSLVDTDIPTTEASNPNTFVIIFANEDYKNVASVPFAKNDGSVFQKYCQRTLGIPVSNIQYVENASYNDIRIKLAWLNDVCDAYNGQASVIVYYAGHGIPDPSNKAPYLLPVDGDGRYVQSAYSLDDFYQKLGAMNAKTVAVFMDACFSGTKREEGMLVAARGVAIQVKNGQPQGNMVVFSAATGEEAAYPDAEEGHGMFTYYLLKKLQQTKGDVTLQALGEYICTNVRQQSIVKNGKLQTPTVLNSPSATDWQTWKLK